MTDAQAALAQVREALAVGPTPGPWHHCQPFQSVRAERTIHGPVPAQRVDFVSTKTQPVHERIIIPMAGREAHVRSEDMAFIAACNPENIAALLAHVEAQAAEIERLTAERDELRRQLAEAEQDARRYRDWLRGGANIPPESTRWARWEVRHWDGRHWNTLFAEQMDAAIDAAMGGGDAG